MGRRSLSFTGQRMDLITSWNDPRLRQAGRSSAECQQPHKQACEEPARPHAEKLFLEAVEISAMRSGTDRNVRSRKFRAKCERDGITGESYDNLVRRAAFVRHAREVYATHGPTPVEQLSFDDVPGRQELIDKYVVKRPEPEQKRTGGRPRNENLATHRRRYCKVIREHLRYLSHVTAKVLAFFEYHASYKDGYVVTTSHQFIADFTGITKGSVTKAVAELVERGILKVEQRGFRDRERQAGKPSTYRLYP